MAIVAQMNYVALRHLVLLWASSCCTQIINKPENFVIQTLSETDLNMNYYLDFQPSNKDLETDIRTLKF